MKLFSITYDLKQPGRNYSELYEEIKSMAGENRWQHPLESCWFVKVEDSVTVKFVSDHLRARMDARDSLIIVDITKRPYQGWLPGSFWEWMRQ